MRAQTGRFRDLVAWQLAYKLALSLYQATKTFPSDEKFGLTQQMRRAAVSISSNIAEGWGRGTTQDYLRFVGIARGSLHELQTQSWLSAYFNYLATNHEIFSQMSKLERVINGLHQSLEDKLSRG